MQSGANTAEQRCYIPKDERRDQSRKEDNPASEVCRAVKLLCASDTRPRMGAYEAVALSRMVVFAYHWYSVNYLGLAAFFIQELWHHQLLLVFTERWADRLGGVRR